MIIGLIDGGGLVIGGGSSISAPFVCLLILSATFSP